MNCIKSIQLNNIFYPLYINSYLLLLILYILSLIRKTAKNLKGEICLATPD